MPFADFATKHCPKIKRSEKKPRTSKKLPQKGDKIHYEYRNIRVYGIFDRIETNHCNRTYVWAEWDIWPGQVLDLNISIVFLEDGTPLTDLIDAFF